MKSPHSELQKLISEQVYSTIAPNQRNHVWNLQWKVRQSMILIFEPIRIKIEREYNGS